MILSLISKELSNISIAIKEAYEMAKKLPDRNFLVSCIDSPDYWAFLFSPEVIEPDDSYIGGLVDGVCKKTGEIKHFAVPYDMSSLTEEGKPVDVSMFTG